MGVRAKGEQVTVKSLYSKSQRLSRCIRDGFNTNRSNDALVIYMVSMNLDCLMLCK